MNYKVYILFSEKLNRFYTGFTSDIVVVMSFHQHSENRKFIRKANDWVIFLPIDCESKIIIVNQKIIKISESTKSI